MSEASFEERTQRSDDVLKRDLLLRNLLLSDACWASKYLAWAEMCMDFQKREYARAKGTGEESVEESVYREVCAHYTEIRALQAKRSKAALAIAG